MWADIPQDVFLRYHGELFAICSLLSMVYDPSQSGHETVKKAIMKFLGGQLVYSVVHVTDDSQLVKEQVLGQCPDLKDIVTLVLPHIEGIHWKRVGLALGMKKCKLDVLEQAFLNDNDRYLETLSYWLEHGSSVTWKTLLDALGHFETKHTIGDLTDKIFSKLGGVHQVSVGTLCFHEGTVWCAVWGGRCCSFVVCLHLCCLLHLLSDSSCERSY